MLAADAFSIGSLLVPDSNTTISRQELFEMVWSRPISQIASDFGVSGTAVAKACKSLNVLRATG
jgi:DNA-binding winged helix-turn-helix (wHTH) protein